MLAGSNHLKKALALCRSKNYDGAEALALLEKADKAGSAEAAYALGTWYLFGKHVRKNYRTAAEYLQRAADKNYASAAHDLAISYEKGAGVPKDKHEAFRLYMKAARLGDRQAAYEVGRCFYWGIGTAKDRSVAEVWFDGFDHAEQDRKIAASAKPTARRIAPRPRR